MSNWEQGKRYVIAYNNMALLVGGITYREMKVIRLLGKVMEVAFSDEVRCRWVGTDEVVLIEEIPETQLP